MPIGAILLILGVILTFAPFLMIFYYIHFTGLRLNLSEPHGTGHQVFLMLKHLHRTFVVYISVFGCLLFFIGLILLILRI